VVTFDGRAPGTSPEVWSDDARYRALHTLPRPGAGRVVVVAAHPDDETLGAGGLLAELAAAGRPGEVVVVTDGAASHPGSPTIGPAELRDRRAAEVRAAVAVLSPGARVTLLGHPDGAVRDCRPSITADLRRILRDGPAPALVVAPWRGDGHRDHRVTGEICDELARELDVPFVEYPIWLWHWGSPDDPRVPWDRLRALPLADRSVVLKHRAVAEHRTQVRALSAAAADLPPLHPSFVQGFDRDVEVYVTSAPDQPHDLGTQFFDDAYARRDDPWRLASRWYERRKRDATVAALPEERVGRGLEVGCSIGMLTELLAVRVDELTATDVSPAALRQAEERTAHLDNVHLLRHDIADGVPDGPYDLVVLSEVGYYLTRPRLQEAVAAVRAALTATGTVVACHWRHPVDEYPLSGDDVHRVLDAELDLPRLVRHVEEDFLLDVWSRDARSVARRSGLA
jgi:LmbE family N-acetylglucosaminyl deacetylase/SAM-dependent methyltransferase